MTASASSRRRTASWSGGQRSPTSTTRGRCWQSHERRRADSKALIPPLGDRRAATQGTPMNIDDDIARIAEQERRLRFASFNEDTAWELGSRLRQLAVERGVAVAIEVRLARETVFFCAMPGTSAANADWARRKRNTAELLSRSSYGV